MVSEKVTAGINVSLQFFLDEMGDASPVTPLFELCVELHEPNIVFIPSVYTDDPDNFYNFVDGLLNNILFMSEHMKRITSEHDEPNYLQDVLNNDQVVEYMQDILHRAQYAMDAAVEYIKNFDDYSYLWLDDRQEVLRYFLLYGRQLTPDELDLLKDETRAEEIKQTPPTIEQFKEQIDFYEDLYKKLEKIEMEMILEGGWMRVDVKRLRQAVLNNVCKWGNLFKQHLYNHVLNSLNELELFIQESIAVMEKPLAEDDYDGLLVVMGYLFKVKERQIATDNMFEPLKQIMDLLKEYGVEFGEEVYVQLQEAPDKWIQCKKIAVATKQAVAPLQANQVNAIRRRISLFDIRQTMYRDTFKKLPFFNWSCTEVYKLLDTTNAEITELENEMTKLQEQANLFELTLPEFKMLKLNRKEVRQVKQLWDYVNIVRSCIDEWKTTPWKKIDVEAMEMECKKFGKEIKAMDKELRAWDVYIQMEATVKNILTSLRAVSELQNPAIRERHWIQLMQATKVSIFV